MCCQPIRAPEDGGRVRVGVGLVIHSDTAIEHSGVAVDFPPVQGVSATRHLCKVLALLSLVCAITRKPRTHHSPPYMTHSVSPHPLTIAGDCNTSRASVAEERVHKSERLVLFHISERGERSILSQRLPSDVEGPVPASEEGARDLNFHVHVQVSTAQNFLCLF